MNSDAPHKLKRLMDLELSDRELYFIGRIIAAWGALESEIFTQTLLALTNGSTDKLPEAMNNMQPSRVRSLWKTHVIDKADSKRQPALLEQYEKIERYSEYRHAIVHGMWEWSKAEPEKITVWRVRQDALESLIVTADDLMNLSMEIDQINYSIRFPADEDLINSGPIMSRHMLATLTNHPIAKDLWPHIDADE